MWAEIIAAERRFDRDHLYEDRIDVVVEVLTGADSDDPYNIPTLLSSGVTTIPGTFEYGLFENYRFTPGGSVARGDAYFMCGAEWESKFKADGAYVEKDGVRYIKTSITKSKIADSMIVTLGKKS